MKKVSLKFYKLLPYPHKQVLRDNCSVRLRKKSCRKKYKRSVHSCTQRFLLSHPFSIVCSRRKRREKKGRANAIHGAETFTPFWHILFRQWTSHSFIYLSSRQGKSSLSLQPSSSQFLLSKLWIFTRSILDKVSHPCRNQNPNSDWLILFGHDLCFRP